MITASNKFKNLIIRAKNGDTGAFSTVYSEFFTPLYRYVFYILEDSVQAEDITQTVFIKAYENLANLNTDDTASPLAYLYTIARNMITDSYRKAKPVNLDESFEHKSNEDVQKDFEVAERNKILAQVLGELTAEQRDVVVLRYFNDLSYEDISKIMNKSADALRQIQHRSLKIMKEKLETLEYK